MSYVSSELLAEMTLDPVTHETAFWKCAPGAASLAAAAFLELAGRPQLVPLSWRNNLLRHSVVLLPSRPEEYGDSLELLADVRQFIHRHVDLPGVFEEVCAHYVLFSWRYDEFNEVPYLRVLGDYGTGKTRFLQTVGSITYKPMFASGASTVSPLFRILDLVQGTLIFDEADFRFSDERAEVVKILNNGNARGFPVLRTEATPQKEFNPRAFHVFGPKLIATRRPFADPALESRCITELLGGRPLRRDIPINLPDRFHDEARSIRNKLLSYRFRTWSTGKIRDAAGLGLEPRIAQVFLPLLSIIEDDDARGRVAAVAARANEALQRSRSSRVEALVLEAIAALLRRHVELSVRAIATQFARDFGEDFSDRVTPRWIGSVLRRRLGLSPEKRGGVFVVPASDFERLEYLFERYGVGDVGDVGDEPKESAAA